MGRKCEFTPYFISDKVDCSFNDIILIITINRK